MRRDSGGSVTEGRDPRLIPRPSHFLPHDYTGGQVWSQDEETLRSDKRECENMRDDPSGGKEGAHNE